ncbi:hypothetical protein WEI85_18900 [Actinomycetes bacterium KLBMP 9797]
MDTEKDRDHAAMRTLLSSVGAPPGGHIMGSALLADGRRIRRRRRSAASVAGVFVITAVALGGYGVVDRTRDVPTVPAAEASPPSAPCTVTALGLPAKATSGAVNAGSPNGGYLAGFSSVGGSPPTPLRWDGTRAEPIGVAGSGEAQGVNDDGVVVGNGQSAAGRSFAWAYANGTVTELPIPTGWTGAEANAVNARGDVAGTLFGPDRAAAVVWRNTGSTTRAEILDAPQARAMAWGISDEGIVVGTLDDGRQPQPYRWDAHGKGQRLTTPAGYTGGAARGVRGDWAYGYAYRSTGTPTGTPPSRGTYRQQPQEDADTAGLWNLRTGQFVAVAADGEVEDVSSGGATVVNRAGGGALLRGPDGVIRELPGLSTTDTTAAYARSDDGTRAAGVSAHTPVRWTCPRKGN